MSPLVWAGIAGTTIASILLVTRKAKAQAMQPPPDPVYGEQTLVPLAVPSGWRRATNADIAAAPDLVTHATTLRDTPGFTSMQYGTLAPFVAFNGKTYATWVEQHYHPPEGDARPWGYHHGVTLLASTTAFP